MSTTMQPVFMLATLLLQVEGFDAIRSVIEAGGFDLGVQGEAGYLSREYWGSCTFPTGTGGYQGRVSPGVVFASRTYYEKTNVSPLLRRYRIELLDVISHKKEIVDTQLTAVSGRTIALSGDALKLAVAGIDLQLVGGQRPPVSREGIWLFSREEQGRGWSRSFLLKAASDDDVNLRWAHDSERLVLSERRLGGETVVIDPHSGGVRRLKLSNASPSPRIPVLASRHEQNGSLLLSDLNDGTVLHELDTRILATSPKWSPDGKFIYYIGVVRGAADVQNACIFDLDQKTEYCGPRTGGWIGDETDWVAGCRR